MSEEFRQLQSHMQRAAAVADQLDRRLESPASARLVAAVRAVHVAMREMVAPTAPSNHPPDIGEAIEFEIAPSVWLRGTIRQRSRNGDGDLVFWCVGDHGSFEAVEGKCRRT